MEDYEKSGDLNTFIGKGSVVEGVVKVQSSLRIDGRLKGQISTTESMVIGQQGEIEGEAKVKNAVVGGKFKGKIFATGKVTLEAKSTFHGELKTSKLVIHEGAVFEGVCSMSEDGKPMLAEGTVSAGKLSMGERAVAAR